MKEVVFLRTEFNYDRDEASEQSGLKCTDPSLAKQSMAQECDINYIAERYGLYGELPSNVRMPTFGDFTGVSDFQTAMNAALQAEESFMQMPAKVRARFDNDPQKFLEFCSDEKNLEEAKQLGLVQAEKMAASLVVAASAATMPAGAGSAPAGGAAAPAAASTGT